MSQVFFNNGLWHHLLPHMQLSKNASFFMAVSSLALALRIDALQHLMHGRTQALAQVVDHTRLLVEKNECVVL